MPNPRPGFQTTGTFSTREDLERAVRNLRADGLDWTAIANQLGISPRTAKRIHDEIEAAIKEAREAAYALAARTEDAVADVATTTGLKPATVIYIGLIVAAIIAILLIR
jgi:hypothetical protein